MDGGRWGGHGPGGKRISRLAHKGRGPDYGGKKRGHSHEKGKTEEMERTCEVGGYLNIRLWPYLNKNVRRIKKRRKGAKKKGTKEKKKECLSQQRGLAAAKKTVGETGNRGKIRQSRHTTPGMSGRTCLTDLLSRTTSVIRKKGGKTRFTRDQGRIQNAERSLH